MKSGRIKKWSSRQIERIRVRSECQCAVLGRWSGVYDFIFGGSIGGMAAVYQTLAHVSLLFIIPFVVSVLGLFWNDSKLAAQGKLLLEKNPLLREPRNEGEIF